MGKELPHWCLTPQGDTTPALVAVRLYEHSYQRKAGDDDKMAAKGTEAKRDIIFHMVQLLRCQKETKWTGESGWHPFVVPCWHTAASAVIQEKGESMIEASACLSLFPIISNTCHIQRIPNVLELSIQCLDYIWIHFLFLSGTCFQDGGLILWLWLTRCHDHMAGGDKKGPLSGWQFLCPLFKDSRAAARGL